MSWTRPLELLIKVRIAAWLFELIFGPGKSPRNRALAPIGAKSRLRAQHGETGWSQIPVGFVRSFRTGDNTHHRVGVMGTFANWLLTLASSFCVLGSNE
jgi:hypothetical protein